MAASENEPLYLLPHVLEIGKIERVGNKFDKKKQCMERLITISIEEYNKLIDMHTKERNFPKDRSKEVHIKVVEMAQKSIMFASSLQ